MPMIHIIMALLRESLEGRKSVFIFFLSHTLGSLAHGGAQYVFIELNWKERHSVDQRVYLGELIILYKLIIQGTDFYSFKQIHFHVFLNTASLKYFKD